MAEDRTLSTYLVGLPDGRLTTVRAEYCFNNDGSLVFRTGPKGRCPVIATFAPGGWHSCVIQDGTPPWQRT